MTTTVSVKKEYMTPTKYIFDELKIDKNHELRGQLSLCHKIQVNTGNEENLPIIVTIVTKGQIYCKSFPKQITICWWSCEQKDFFEIQIQIVIFNSLWILDQNHIFLHFIVFKVYSTYVQLRRSWKQNINSKLFVKF